MVKLAGYLAFMPFGTDSESKIINDENIHPAVERMIRKVLWFHRNKLASYRLCCLFYFIQYPKYNINSEEKESDKYTRRKFFSSQRLPPNQAPFFMTYAKR